jgi:hypothetical protein
LSTDPLAAVLRHLARRAESAAVRRWAGALLERGETAVSDDRRHGARKATQKETTAM